MKIDLVLKVGTVYLEREQLVVQTIRQREPACCLAGLTMDNTHESDLSTKVPCRSGSVKQVSKAKMYSCTRRPAYRPFLCLFSSRTTMAGEFDR